MIASRSRVLRVVFGLAIWVALIATVFLSWGDVKTDLIRAGPLFPLTVGLVAMGLLSAARGWAVLQPQATRSRSFVGFLAAQPAKYLPVGGVLQAVGQVEMSSSPEHGRKEVGWVFLVHAGIEVAAAAFIGLLILFDLAAPDWIRITLTVLAAACALALRRGVVEGLIRFLTRLMPRIRPVGSAPLTEAIWRSLAWSTVPLLLTGASFAILLGLSTPPVENLSTIGIFSVAWVVGFLAFPLPSGLGAREAVLVALLPGRSAAQVLGVSLILRFSTFVAELVLLALVSRPAFLKSERSN